MKTRNNNRTAGRLGALLAAVGMLVISSGLALALTAAPANAAGPKECTEGTGWIEVNVNALTYTYNADPGKVITDVCAKGPDAFPVFVLHLDPPTTSYTFKSADYGWVNGNDQLQDISHIGVKLADEPEEQPKLTTAGVQPVQPTCVNSNVASYTTSGDHVTFTQSAAPAPGASITVTAKTDAGWEFDGGATTKDFPLVFNAAETPCTKVAPPEQTPPVVDPPSNTTPQTKTKSTVVTPTLVHAGLADVAGDSRVEQGLALTAAGMVMLVAGGGLGLARIRRGSEI